MQRILNLIEGTLDAEVTPQELADHAGYSLWHFLHLFQREVGMPLCRYRTRRRLAHAIWDVSRGMGVTDAALNGALRAIAGSIGPSGWNTAHRPATGCAHTGLQSLPSPSCMRRYTRCSPARNSAKPWPIGALSCP